ncbi:MAG TPA: DNA repair protein RecN [Verrucomicrobiae bacterium]|nr:DNA repair protein RecN [Verrucomicrobiae bacterium]
MLATLRIKNLALVADLTLELQPGYNVITGETGAGKSILIGALNLVLGERADRTLIRSGADASSVEAVFDTAKLPEKPDAFLEENGLEPCADNQLIVKRTITAAGSSRQFINGSPTTLAVLGALGERLVDIHGPHDHQSLFSPARQLAILDAYAGLEPVRARISEAYASRARFVEEKAALIVDEKTYAQQIDLLRHQATEIAAAKLTEDEEPRIEAEYKRASNSARLIELVETATRAISEDENSVLTQLGAVGRALHELARLDESAAGLAEQQHQAVSLLNDLQAELSDYRDRLDLDPARLQELEERLNLIHTLKRKYGSSLVEVIAFGNEARKKLQQLESRDAEVARINDELQKAEAALLKAARELSGARSKAIPKLAKAVMAQLADLGFKQSHFAVTMKQVGEAGPTGIDEADFQFAPNPGEPAKPLKAIASSGEIARVMLAIKTVLAAEDQIPVLIFDEVDANVGGETAAAVGAKMRQIGAQRQVLCITHLPPVAAAAQTHYLVTKEVKEGRTISKIEPLTKATRVVEITRMLGGDTPAARKHAQALLAEAG